MNKSNFLQTGGYPLIDERLDDIQNAYSIFNAIGYLAGDKTIITGCLPIGANTTNGYVFLNGELYPFKEGATGTTVKIIAEVTNDEFEDGSVKDVHTKYYVTFATGENTYPWADFKRVSNLVELMSAIQDKAATTALTALTTRVTKLEVYAAPFAVSNGSMVFWRKPANQIPAGWQEVTDWRGRLAIGRDPDDTQLSTIGAPVGSKTASFDVAIPYNGWGYTASEKPDTGKGGRLVVSNNQHEDNEYFESLAVANGNKTVAVSANVLNPARIVMYIEPIPAP